MPVTMFGLSMESARTGANSLPLSVLGQDVTSCILNNALSGRDATANHDRSRLEFDKSAEMCAMRRC